MAQHSQRPPDGHFQAHASLQARQRMIAQLAVCMITAFLGGCSSVRHSLFGHTTPVASPNSGIVVADEPQAALVGRDVLARGGNAADAAAATAFALSVSLPSRASLGGGGACLVTQPHQEARAIIFLPVAGSGNSGGMAGSRPASVPMMARGIYLMQLRYGNVQLGDVISPAITLARYGITVSRPLAKDIAAVHGPLTADNTAFSIFSKDDGSPLTEGDLLVQTRLTSFLSRLKLVGIGDLYNGALSEVFVNQANNAGGNLTREDLRKATPQESPALTLTDGNAQIAFLPPPADGGLGAAMAYSRGIPAEQAISAWRRSGLSGLQAAQAFLKQGQTDGGRLPPLPASTSFVVNDHNGMAVACTLSENNLFGTGRVAGTTGVVLGASPRIYPKPLLSAAILHTAKGQLEAVLATSGQNDAAQTLSDALRHAVSHQTITTGQASEGRLNAIRCTQGGCQGIADPRGDGMSAQTPLQH